MSPKQTLAVVIRLIAVWLMIFSVSTVLSLIVKSKNNLLQLTSGPLITIIIITAILLSICLILWHLSNKISGFILHDIQNTPFTPSSPDSWFAVGCSLLGIWFIGNIIPPLLANVYIAMSIDHGFSDILTKAHMLSETLKLSLGLLLIVGWNRIRRLINSTHHPN